MCAILAVDTSTSRTYAAVRTEEGAVFEDSVSEAKHAPFSHNEELAGRVGGVLNIAGITAKDIDILLVGEGPGSFTGLRIGFSFMKGLSFALSIPLYSISSLKAAAFAESEPADLIVPVADARRAEIFCAMYQTHPDGRLDEIVPASILTAAGLAGAIDSEFKKLKRPDAAIVLPAADGVETEIAQVMEALPAEARRNCVVKRRESAGAGLIAAYLQTRADGGEFSLERLAQLSPRYLRAVAALTIEERKARKAAQIS